MHAHRVKVVVSEDHQVTFALPSDFPSGEAEVIVLTTASQSHRKTSGAEAATDFATWLEALLVRLPPAPAIPLDKLRRESLYEDE